jgi:LacI family gluconate utilization system Gnt-I transcriptional repressor
VRVDGTAIGRLAARLLVDRIEGRDKTTRVVDVGFSVVPRGTS